MNARQKAKYYKRKYEELAANKYVPKVTEEHYRITTLQVSRKIPTFLATKEEGRFQYIKEALLREMADNLDAYVKYSTDFNNDRRYYQYTAKLDVVEKCNY